MVCALSPVSRQIGHFTSRSIGHKTTPWGLLSTCDWYNSADSPFSLQKLQKGFNAITSSDGFGMATIFLAGITYTPISLQDEEFILNGQGYNQWNGLNVQLVLNELYIRWTRRERPMHRLVIDAFILPLLTDLKGDYGQPWTSPSSLRPSSLKSANFNARELSFRGIGCPSFSCRNTFTACRLAPVWQTNLHVAQPFFGVRVHFWLTKTYSTLIANYKQTNDTDEFFDFLLQTNLNDNNLVALISSQPLCIAFYRYLAL